MSQPNSPNRPPNPNASPDNTNPKGALVQLRERMQKAVAEYSAGKLNSRQFQAIYQHYTEKRVIIEKLLERDPDTDAWKSVVKPGHTGQLRRLHESRPIHYAIFRRGEKRPVQTGGKLPRVAAEQIHKLLRVLFSMKNPRKGLARKSMGNGMWLVLALGDYSMTMVTFSLQPTSLQIERIRDMHDDFERANMRSLRRGLQTERLVFPQRALIEQ